MPLPIPDKELRRIEEILRKHPAGLPARRIADLLETALSHRTVQYRLKRLVDSGRVVMHGKRRGAKYTLSPRLPQRVQAKSPVPLSKRSRQLLALLERPTSLRTATGYKGTFLDTYRPNDSAYLSLQDRVALANVGRPNKALYPAGTYAKRILQRLLIDLSWNSSRLEGNTYSLLDTRRLIEAGDVARGKTLLETQMILNHKDAITFLVDAIDEIAFNRYTICNLHAILASNLLPEPHAAGRLRRIPVGISGSVFYPLEVPQQIEELFDRILSKATEIRDPFEQSFFLMVHLPYLQPFDDVNKRVSRLAANIPLIKGSLAPLTFAEVSRRLYTLATLSVYELNDVSLLRDVYRWAYGRSAQRYVAVRQSLGEPDPFRLRYRSALQDVICSIIRGRAAKAAAIDRLSKRVEATVNDSDRTRFRETVLSELEGLNWQNFARYRVTLSEFEGWRRAWCEHTDSGGRG